MIDPALSKEECGHCRFWDVVIAGGSYQGQCRRHAPTRNIEHREQTSTHGFYTDAPGNNALWPLTRTEWWCGDFEPLLLPDTE